MFLKKKEFTYNGESVTLFELSALQRIEVLKVLAQEEKAVGVDSEAISDQDMTARLVGSNIRCGAHLIAMSLWHNDPAGADVDTLYQQVLNGWPPAAIGKAEMEIKLLSGMLPPIEDDNAAGVDDAADTETAAPVTAEKPLPAS